MAIAQRSAYHELNKPSKKNLDVISQSLSFDYFLGLKKKRSFDYSTSIYQIVIDMWEDIRDIKQK